MFLVAKPMREGGRQKAGRCGQREKPTVIPQGWPFRISPREATPRREHNLGEVALMSSSWDEAYLWPSAFNTPQSWEAVGTVHQRTHYRR